MADLETFQVGDAALTGDDGDACVECHRIDQHVGGQQRRRQVRDGGASDVALTHGAAERVRPELVRVPVGGATGRLVAVRLPAQAVVAVDAGVGVAMRRRVAAETRRLRPA